MEATTIHINAGFINDGGYTDWVNRNKFCASSWLKKYGPLRYWLMNYYLQHIKQQKITKQSFSTES